MASTTPTETLQQLRQQIDTLDQQLQSLISQRAELALRVGEIKQAEQAPFYRPEREAQVLRRIMERNAGPVSAADMARLFREIMSVCLALEAPLTIAYLSQAGELPRVAAHLHFGHAARLQSLGSAEAVVDAVAAGDAHYGILPGMVNGSRRAVDLLLDSAVFLCGEVWLAEPPERFLVLGNTSVPPSGQDLTSLALAIDNHPGALNRLLEPLGRHGCNLLRIESRPARPPWQDLFFVDVAGHRDDPALQAALADLDGVAGLLKILGSYPVSVF